MLKQGGVGEGTGSPLRPPTGLLMLAGPMLSLVALLFCTALPRSLGSQTREEDWIQPAVDGVLRVLHASRYAGAKVPCSPPLLARSVWDTSRERSIR